MDFVVRRARDRVDVVECRINPRINPGKLNTAAIEAFRGLYPDGDNYIVSPVVAKPYRARLGGRVFTICTTRDLPE